MHKVYPMMSLCNTLNVLCMLQCIVISDTDNNMGLEIHITKQLDIVQSVLMNFRPDILKIEFCVDCS